jgi:glycosyltransferase involved in cell wall biosynthesis
MQFHLLSFEGPDAYSRAGGIATRVEGLAGALADLRLETHLWFVGDPDLPGHEEQGDLQLHRWAQWVSRHHPGGVYDGEEGKRLEYAASLPPVLLREVLTPHLQAGGRGVILAEEWHTAEAVLHLARLLGAARLSDRVSMLWNANNTFGFDRVPWAPLASAAVLTTVSRYMRQRMWAFGVEPLVVPNGLAADAFDLPDREGLGELRRRFRDRTLMTKMARWDPDKRWLAAIDIVANAKSRGWRPLLLARGGVEARGAEVLEAARARGLRVADRAQATPGVPGLLAALSDLHDVDIVSLRSPVAPCCRRVLLRGSDAVLANSGHEPFGLVGLETMAAGGIACTGATGEEYALASYNALVLEAGTADEFAASFQRLRRRPYEVAAMRRAARSTALRYAWPRILEPVLLPRLEALPERPLRNMVQP